MLTPNCANEEGKVSTVSPLAHTVHPRLLGLVFDAFIRAESPPYEVNGRKVPTCRPVRFQLTGG